MQTTMNPTRMKRKLSYVFSDIQSSVLTEIIHDSYSDLVHTGDFNELKEIVRDLGISQKHTDASLTRLAAAQERTEQRVEDLATSQKELTAAQERTDASLTRLAAAQERTDASLTRLAAAQERTDASLTRLSAAQERTDERVGDLAVAQQKTEYALQNLSKQVGGLSDRMGGDLEDIAYIVLYDVLEREFGWQVGELKRSWQRWGRDEEEVDIFGKAQDPGRPDVDIWILGEVKFNLTLKEVEKFTKQVERARKHLTGEVFPVCFCYRARPEVSRAVKQAGLRMVYSYGKMI